MRKKVFLLVVAFIIVSLCLADNSFTLEKALRTEEVKGEEVSGVFTLILYGARHGDDIETVAVLDLEGDRYTFEPYAPEFDYRVENNVPAGEALERAKRFAGWHPDFRRLQVSRILDGEGKIIGYEVRPLYDPLVFGASDVLEVDYWPRGVKVKVTIKTKPEIEQRRSSNGGPRDSDH